MKEIQSLRRYLLDSSHTERIRRAALRRFDFLGVRDESELRLVEEIADQLLERSTETERNLGIHVASLARTLSKRLRHRLTTDVPSKKVK